MKTANTCTIWFEDGTEVNHVNVTYSRWEGNGYGTFIVQRYDPADENRLQTFVYKRRNIKNTLREQPYSEDIDLAEKRKPEPGIEDENPKSVTIEGLASHFYIVHSEHPDLAYSGSRWVPHIGGYPSRAIKVRGFGSRKEAEAYAKVCFPNAAVKQ